MPSMRAEDVVLKKECGRCHGKGGREVRRRGGKSFWGNRLPDYNEWVRCDACSGTGTNPDYRTKSCRNCWRTIEYSAKTDSSKVPDLCPSCRETARNEKNREREARQNQPRREERRYDSRPKQDSNWREKSCPGLKDAGYCGKTIKYRTDWSRIPDLCPDCIAKIKAIKAERDANTLTGRCEKCGGETRYNKQYKPPRFCKKCKEEREASKRTKSCPYCGKEVVWYAGEREYDCCYNCAGKRNRNRGFFKLGPDDQLPASGRTPKDIGGTNATVKGPNQFGGQHVTVYNNKVQPAEWYSYDTDIDGNYKPGTAHETEAKMRSVYRGAGQERW